MNVVCIVMQTLDGEECVGSEKQTASAQHNRGRNSFTLIDFTVGFCEAVVGRSATRGEPISLKMDELEPESTCASIGERLDVYYGEGLQSKWSPVPRSEAASTEVRRML